MYRFKSTKHICKMNVKMSNTAMTVSLLLIFIPSKRFDGEV
ncbi:hypothetical protein THOD04_110023 [Vibrio owensii]|nr:hypothetical protein THOD04_110023 [Vibrio owensii]